MEKYEDILNNAKELGRVEFIGKTELGFDIPLVHIGKEAKTLLIASVHAREYVTTDVLNAVIAEEKESLNVDYLPMLNIDGVLLAKNGLNSVENFFLRQKLLSINGNDDDFSQWKANINGVDINVNFDADWGEGRHNVTSPSSANYIGKRPHSEKETQAIVELLKRNYALIACYHSLGEEVYWGYEYNFKHYHYAKQYADYVGYKLKRSEYSSGGIKDYYSLNYQGLGLTIEMGEERYGHPYPKEKINTLISRHKGSIALLEKIGEEISERVHGRSLVAGTHSFF